MISAKVAVVTGAAGSVGTAVSQILASRGHHVVMADIDHEGVERGLKRVRTDHPEAELLGYQVDLSDAEAVPQLAADVLKWGNRVDVVVNNAALQLRSDVASIEPEAWHRLLAVNVVAPAALIGAFAAHWRQSSDGASVVNIVSRVWATGGPPAYVSSKAALVGLTRSVAFELGPCGVRCNAVAPSFMVTDFTGGGRSAEELEEVSRRQRELSPLKRVATPEDVARAVAFLASDDASFITGEVLHVCGGTHLPPSG